MNIYSISPYKNITIKKANGLSTRFVGLCVYLLTKPDSLAGSFLPIELPKGGCEEVGVFEEDVDVTLLGRVETDEAMNLRDHRRFGLIFEHRLPVFVDGTFVPPQRNELGNVSRRVVVAVAFRRDRPQKKGDECVEENPR